ncbi:ABC transporter substrate-binding protein [Subtercola boreus]|uniref:Sugar ABC transporter substrate-binding protein n=1 Tax=Subtercola boreus TaxID=120213 RepID=A0A3E0WD72_9MICO|nr:sugar ABC transporter substrate-binding protein [Subtercola boreus]RFA22762.1 sugar ABC transporter substrate-binding protein [Subtercola boreus]RFA23117.1 sugar ABC transporter substrate-binding protein [Subtercola boreus]RFA28870.1 sugar ABC transporter substrate-binding protein [Subtercola boreus]
MELNRRTFLLGAGAASLPLLLAGCGFAPPAADSTAATGTLTFTTWGTDAELAGFKAAIDRFQKANSGATVNLNAVPYGQMFTNIDAQLQAGNPPDVFRVPYYTFGSYAGRGQLLDLSTQLEQGFSDNFTPQAWAAVQNSGKPYGVPHHTDTSVILYNKDALTAAGITNIPTTLDTAWSWDEFEQVMKTLRGSLPAEKYPFAYNWQGNGVTRWLSWLFESNGRFLSEDLLTPAIDSPAGTAAVDFTKNFFTAGYVPQNNSVKSTTLAADTWYAQTSAMTSGGAFLIPDATSTLDFEWGATFSPRNERSAGDFGGNALVATAATTQPELATKFLAFMTEQEEMSQFCASASLLPTRADLIQSGIDFAVRPELSPIFVGQASSVQAQDSSQVASPNMSKIITVLQNQLEEAFVGGQSTADTLANMTSGIAAATAPA